MKLVHLLGESPEQARMKDGSPFLRCVCDTLLARAYRTEGIGGREMWEIARYESTIRDLARGCDAMGCPDCGRVYDHDAPYDLIAHAPAVWMYHISPRSNRASILRDGLRLSDSPSPYVWLFRDRNFAKDMMAKWSPRGNVPMDLWIVNVSGLDLQPDPHPGGPEYGEGQSWISTAPIPTERLYYP
jgi:hypothetical protein